MIYQLIMKNKRKILVIDDEKAILFAFKEVLSESWLSIDTAQSFKEAEQLLQNRSYQGAIIDLRLNGSKEPEGFKIIQLIKKHHPHCRVIVLTAYGQTDTKEKVFSLGADYFLEKPVSPEEIKKIFKALGVY